MAGGDGWNTLTSLSRSEIDLFSYPMSTETMEDGKTVRQTKFQFAVPLGSFYRFTPRSKHTTLPKFGSLASPTILKCCFRIVIPIVLSSL